MNLTFLWYVIQFLGYPFASCYLVPHFKQQRISQFCGHWGEVHCVPFFAFSIYFTNNRCDFLLNIPSEPAVWQQKQESHHH